MYTYNFSLPVLSSIVKLFVHCFRFTGDTLFTGISRPFCLPQTPAYVVRNTLAERLPLLRCSHLAIALTNWKKAFFCWLMYVFGNHDTFLLLIRIKRSPSNENIRMTADRDGMSSEVESMRIITSKYSLKCKDLICLQSETMVEYCTFRASLDEL